MTIPPTKLSERAYLGAKAVEALEQDLDLALRMLHELFSSDFIPVAYKVKASDAWIKLTLNKKEREGLE